LRKWYKFKLTSASCDIVREPIDSSYSDHTQAMGGYSAVEAYKSRSDFFNRYFFNFSRSRLDHYHSFLKKHLDRSNDILSVGSGRCANELYLLQDGFKITCSDLAMLPAYEATKKLFADFKFVKFDVLSGSTSRKYDAILCLSLMYLFDETKMRSFFRNVSDSLNDGGTLILDPGGCFSNPMSYVLDNILLKYEALVIRGTKFMISGKKGGLIIKEFGYRKRNKDIIECAKEAGFMLSDRESYDYLTEFSRSYFLKRAIKRSPACRKIVGSLGRTIPYINLFKFRLGAVN